MTRTTLLPAMQNAATSDTIAQALSLAIHEHRIAPGTKLGEDELAEIYGVSRTVFRASLQRLSHLKLVDIRRNKGAKVASPSLTEAHEVHELRVALEPLALRSAMQTGNDAWRANLDTAYATLAEELRRGAPDRGAIEEAHRNYHLTLLSACSSAWMIRLIDLLNSHIIRYWTLTAAPRRDTDHVLDEHQRLHELVLAGKTEVAVAELAAHLQHALHSVAERMTEAVAD